mmetsp:Transcript_73811/g.196440  ORF Transcript_73811/g.196440 Transcript_73811/m.196440 type:complete len:219 (+) Transcript_73811:2490-3146(+)
MRTNPLKDCGEAGNGPNAKSSAQPSLNVVASFPAFAVRGADAAEVTTRRPSNGPEVICDHVLNGEQLSGSPREHVHPISTRQRDEQPSPLTVLPSSHSSMRWYLPSGPSKTEVGSSHNRTPPWSSVQQLVACTSLTPSPHFFAETVCAGAVERAMLMVVVVACCVWNGKVVCTRDCVVVVARAVVVVVLVVVVVDTTAGPHFKLHWMQSLSSAEWLVR